MMKASVIITSYNNAHNLVKCLNSLITQNYDQSLIDLEIIFVDSGSTDSSIKILNNYRNKIKIILNPGCAQKRLSPALARNLGAEKANGEILIFSDADCFFLPDWIKRTLSNFKNKEIDCVLGSREPDIGKGLGTYIRKYNFILYSRKFRVLEVLLMNQKALRQGFPLILMAANNFAITKEV